MRKALSASSTAETISQQILVKQLSCIHDTVHVLLFNSQDIIRSTSPADPDCALQPFSLTMKTLFEDASVPEELDSAEDTIFDLTELREVVGEQALAEKDREIERARAIWKRRDEGDLCGCGSLGTRGFWEAKK